MQDISKIPSEIIIYICNLCDTNTLRIFSMTLIHYLTLCKKIKDIQQG